MDIIRRCVSGFLALTLWGCGDGSTDDGTSASEASPGDVGAARAYVGHFATENPDLCFADVELDHPQLEAGANNWLGPRFLPVRVVVAIDGSGSMAGRIGTRTKLDLAREATTRFLDGLPSSVEASLIVFGQQGDNSEVGKDKSCAGVDLLVPMSSDRTRLGSAVSRVRAVGWTPLAAGLERAQALFARSSNQGEQVIYVVSDGQETCGGDPVAVAQRINSGTTRAIINILGFGLSSSDEQALKAVSDAGGGDFVNVNNRADYDHVLGEIREANRHASNALRQSNAVASNAGQTSNAISSAAVCISNIISGEHLRMSNDLSARALRGEALPFARTAEGFLKERHNALELRLERYSARLQGNEFQTRGRINEVAKTAR